MKKPCVRSCRFATFRTSPNQSAGILQRAKTRKKLSHWTCSSGNLLLSNAKPLKHFNRIHLAQCLTQLRTVNKKLGLVINFGEKYVRDGIHRVANGL